MSSPTQEMTGSKDIGPLTSGHEHAGSLNCSVAIARSSARNRGILEAEETRMAAFLETKR